MSIQMAKIPRSKTFFDSSSTSNEYSFHGCENWVPSYVYLHNPNPVSSNFISNYCESKVKNMHA